jgi:hypothetical protein
MKSSILVKILASVGCAAVPASDLALGAAGVGLAGVSVSFAAVMLVRTGQMPGVNGAEHFAIFSQPASVPYTGNSPDAPFREAAALDYTPIGTVFSKRGGGQADRGVDRYPPAAVLAGFRMRGMFQNEALVQGPSGFLMVKPGTDIEGAGSVTAIEARGRRWVIVTTTGVIEGDD